MRESNITFMAVISRRSEYGSSHEEITHVTARESYGKCPVCGRDVPERTSAACPLHQATTEEMVEC